MFNLSVIEHNLPVPPHLLSLPLADAVKEELEKLFLDKVIPNLGLCVSVYDVRSIEGGFVVPGDGHSIYKVVCRLLMFRPFIGEVITAKIQESNDNGLRLSLGFFNDVYVPVDLMQEPSTFGKDGIWTWHAETDSSTGMLTLDLDEEIRFQVKNVRYPSIPIEQDENAKPFAPMEITAAINESGLGLISWWES